MQFKSEKRLSFLMWDNRENVARCISIASRGRNPTEWFPNDRKRIRWRDQLDAHLRDWTSVVPKHKHVKGKEGREAYAQ